jgi:predicted XRE-type DNA-binding protein
LKVDITLAAWRYKITHEAAVMLLRCELAEALRKWMTRGRLTQAQAAKRLGVVQPYVSEIACNMVDKLSLDCLVGLCAKAGLTVAVRLIA